MTTTWTNSSGFFTGSERSSTVMMIVKIAVFAPMPSASVSTDTAVKPGFFSNCQKAKRRSFIFGFTIDNRAKHQKPNTDLQRKSKLQIPNDAAIPAYWSLDIEASLVLGAWCLVFSS